MNIPTSKSLFQQAQQVIPGGVNSPVRAFKSVGGDPLFIRRAKGAYVYDEDGNAYVELINSWGPMILGHAHPEVEAAVTVALKNSFSFGAPTAIEVEMARLIVDGVESIEKVRMVNSGTEATMSAIRLARGYTGRDKIIKFAGCYHGHGDSFLIAAGSGAMTFGSPDSPGVTRGTAQDTLIARYNDLAQVQELVHSNPGKVAAIILEPVTGNMGVILPQQGFLEGLRKLCDEAGIMDYVSPQGPVYQAGTLSGNPVAMAAGRATLSILRKQPEIYKQVETTTQTIANGMQELLKEKGIPHHLGRIGSMFTVFFSEQEVRNFEDAKACDTALFGSFFKAMLAAGVYLAPSEFEALFVSAAVGELEIERILAATRKALAEL